MWRPPEKIRYEPSLGRIPTRCEALTSRLFSAVRVGRLRLNQRTWVPAMVPWRADPGGGVTGDVLDWYGRFARGRPGAIVVEATGIRDVPSGPLLRIGHDRFIPGLEKLVEVVKAESKGETRLFIQLIDFLTIRRRPDPIQYFKKYLQLSQRHRQAFPGLADETIRSRLTTLSHSDLVAVLSEAEQNSLWFGYRETINDLHLDHVGALPNVLPQLFAKASLRAQAAGFDGVELHFAHAYTMASFLSATNRRTDGYGGTLDNRVRLPLEVHRAVRQQVADEFVVGCRFLSEEGIAGGSSLYDAMFFACKFAQAGMDFLSLSRGGKFDDAKQPNIGQAAYPYTGPSGYECMPQFISDERGPFGRNFAASKAIREAISAAGYSVPVVGAGGIHNFEMAEQAIAEGVCDIVAAARQSLADPDWFLKLSLGMGEQVRVCQFTNYCEGLDQKHKQVTCKLWDRADADTLDASRSLSTDRRRRLIAPEWVPTKVPN
jgi:dimethylglycine catabolism A